MRRLWAALIVLGLVGGIGQLNAAPIPVPPAGITSFEDFEDFQPGNLNAPFAIAGARFNGELPIVTASTSFCEFGQCLITNSLRAPRSFYSFASETKTFGFRLNALNDADQFEIWTVGRSGSQAFSQVGSAALAFADPAGLLAVSVVNIGRAGGSAANYSFDNVYTGNAVVTPLPSAVVLFGAGLASLAGWRRLRRD